MILRQSFLMISLTLALANTALAQGERIKIGPDSTIAELDQMENSIKGIECRYVSEIPGTVTCLTETEEGMRRLMGRVSYYVEGAPGKTLVAENDPQFLATPQAQYAGHDIQSEDMEEFFRASEKACQTDQRFCLNALETQLRDQVLSIARERGYQKYVVLAAAGYTGYMSMVLSHEYLHARYFLNADYRAHVKKFWIENLDAETRQGITKALGHTYNLTGAQGEFLLLNEFQAYVLQKDAMYGELGMIALYHGHALREHMAAFIPLEEDAGL